MSGTQNEEEYKKNLLKALVRQHLTHSGLCYPQDEKGRSLKVTEQSCKCSDAVKAARRFINEWNLPYCPECRREKPYEADGKFWHGGSLKPIECLSSPEAEAKQQVFPQEWFKDKHEAAMDLLKKAGSSTSDMKLYLLARLVIALEAGREQ